MATYALTEKAVVLRSEDDVAVAQFLVVQAERRLAAVRSTDAPGHRPPVYELPPGTEPSGPPRTR